MADDDPWAAFGDNEEGTETTPESSETAFLEEVSILLVQHFLKRKVSLATVRIILIVAEESSELSWKETLSCKGFSVSVNKDAAESANESFDAAVLLAPSVTGTSGESFHNWNEQAKRLVCRGGLLVLPKASLEESASFESNYQDMWRTCDSTAGTIVMQKWVCQIQDKCCPWLHQNNSILSEERERLNEATVNTTVHERSTMISTNRLSLASVDKAVKCLRDYGYCIIPQLLEPQKCRAFGEVLLKDLQQVSSILLEREGVDLYHPHQSKCDPSTYRELSMREDLRMDLRHGPLWDKARGGPQGCVPWIVRAREKSIVEANCHKPEQFLRGHVDLLEIVGRVMNPVDKALSTGNFGRHNFSGGGPDGSFQDLRVGPVGGIVSLPGSADQTMHADTPHLFEHTDGLPAHYINVFSPGCASHPHVGQTALVHASHRLQFCAKHTTTSNENTIEDDWKSFVVRPMLELGDVLLFDCRILHFGMANSSEKIQRPVLYANMTQHWFHDPKNWDDERRIFPATDDFADEG